MSSPREMPFKLRSFLNADVLRGWPNRLTIARTLVIPVILLVYPLDFAFTDYLCSFLFAAAAVTDFFDGFLARKYNQISKFGSLIDPIADKMLTAAALSILLHAKLIPPFIAGLLLCRDVLVTGIRLVGHEQNITIEVNQFGKLKTIIGDMGIVFLMVRREEVLGMPAHTIGMLAMWASLILSCYSAWMYLHSYFEKAKISPLTDR